MTPANAHATPIAAAVSAARQDIAGIAFALSHTGRVSVVDLRHTKGGAAYLPDRRRGVSDAYAGAVDEELLHHGLVNKGYLISQVAR